MISFFFLFLHSCEVVKCQAAAQHGLCFHQSGEITKPWITFIEHIFGLWHESLIRYILIHRHNGNADD